MKIHRFYLGNTRGKTWGPGILPDYSDLARFAREVLNLEGCTIYNRLGADQRIQGMWQGATEGTTILEVWDFGTAYPVNAWCKVLATRYTQDCVPCVSIQADTTDYTHPEA